MKEVPYMDDKWHKEALGKRIRAARESLKLSQKDLYDKTKIKDSMISDFERGIREPNTANLAKIAHALNTTMDRLYFGDETIDFIEGTPDHGMKIVNCFSELYFENIISGRTYELEVGREYILLVKRPDAIKRLLAALDDFRNKRYTYSDPDLYLEQLKKSAAADINGL